MKRIWISLLSLATGLSLTLSAAEPVDMAKRAAELKNLRWGMFICWSFSTFSDNDQTRGVTNINFFAAKDCDTDQWAHMAKEAGMGYILFLTKHPDGFCLWDTKTTERKVTKAPLGRDVLAELRKSCDKYGIKLALYFCEGEYEDNKLYHPGGYSSEMKKAQLKELLTQYGPIEYIWFDWALKDGGLSHEATTAWCHQWQPYTLVGYNSWVGQPSGEVRIGECGGASPVRSPFLVAEFTRPILPDKNRWFYTNPKNDNSCLPAETIYRDYTAAVKCGNVFEIDVGPDRNGKLRAIDIETLRKVGEMIRNEPPPPLSAGKPAKASSIWNDPGYEADKAFDGDESTRWAAAMVARSGWLEVDLQKETRIDRAVIKEQAFPRTQEFAIEYRDGEAWKELAHGTVVGGEKQIKFSPVSARWIRLNILKATDTPTIEEFQVF